MQENLDNSNEIASAMCPRLHILPYMSLEIYLWYFWGLSCVFMVPYFEVQNLNIRLVDLSTIFIFIFLAIRISIKKRLIRKKNISSFFMLIIFAYCLALFWPIGGIITVHAMGYIPQSESYIAPFRRLIIVMILLGTYISLSHEKWLIRERALIRGFILGCVLTTGWMVIEQLVYVLSRVSLNERVFQEILGLNPQHTFVNLIGSEYTGFSMPLYRATGFGWDPGTTATLVVLGWFTYNLLPENIVGKRRMTISIFMLQALPLSLSRTAIVGTAIIAITFIGIHLITRILLINFTNKFRHKGLNHTMFRSFYLSIILGLIVIVIIVVTMSILIKLSVLSAFEGIMSFIRSGLEAKTLGEQRHWTYITLVLPALTDSFTAAFLGYGTANTGIAMERVGQGVLPEIEEMASLWDGNWNPESTTVTFALMGGVVSLFALCFCLVLSTIKGITKYMQNPWNVQSLGNVTILLAPVVLGLGYGFNNTIIYILIFLIFIHIWDPKMRDLT